VSKKKRKRSSGIAFRGWAGVATTPPDVPPRPLRNTANSADSDFLEASRIELERARRGKGITESSLLEASSPVPVDHRQEMDDWLVERERDEPTWRAVVEVRLAEALSSVTPLVLEPGRYTAIHKLVRGELRDPLRDRGAPIDTGREWDRLDYHCLRRELGRDGSEAYNATRHWKQIKREQRARRPNCERCGERGRKPMDIHHLHYATIGCERTAIDLVTLCHWCHWREEGRDPFENGTTRWASVQNMIGTILDDDIPF